MFNRSVGVGPGENQRYDWIGMDGIRPQRQWERGVQPAVRDRDTLTLSPVGPFGAAMTLEQAIEYALAASDEY
jgi:hypothetical protein